MVDSLKASRLRRASTLEGTVPLDKSAYQERLRKAEEILEPFFRAKNLDWGPQAVIDLFAQFFSLAEKNARLPDVRISRKETRPFFDFYNRQVGDRIWRATASLSEGPWTAESYAKLDFHKWSKPTEPVVATSGLLPRQNLHASENENGLKTRKGPQPPLEAALKISESVRRANQDFWHDLFQDVMLLNTTPGAEIYEDPPYSTHVFRFGRLTYSDHIWRSVMHGINHDDFCEYVLRPLYYSAMFEVRTLVPRRTSNRELKKVNGEIWRLDALPLLTLCQYCLSPIKRKAGSRNTRNDRLFCHGNSCKNAYHQGGNADPK